MDETWMNIAKLVGVALLTVIGGLGGQRLLNRTANQDVSPVEAQMNLRIAEKDAQIAALTKRIDDLEEDLEKERDLRAEDQRRHQSQIDDLRERFEWFRTHPNGG